MEEPEYNLKAKKVKKSKHRQHSHFGELIDEYYGFIMRDKVPDMYLPTADLAYITSLLNTKFGRNLSFQTVKRVLREEGIQLRGHVPVPATEQP